MPNLSSRRAQIIIRAVAVVAITIIILLTSACATPPTAVSLQPTIQPSPTNTLTPQPSEAPTAIPTLTPTRTPLPTMTPTPDWEKFVPTTWDECASKAHPSAQYAMMKAYNEYAKTHDIVKEAKDFKNSGKYDKPAFQSDVSRGSSAGGYAFGYFAYLRDAIFIGSRECTLPKSSFESSDGEVNATVYFFVPVDEPDKQIITVGKFIFADSMVRDGKTVIGVRDMLAKVLQPDGKYIYRAQIGVQPQPGQVFTLRQSISMDQVDMYKNGQAPGVSLNSGDTAYIGKTGRSLATHLGILSRDEALTMLGKPELQGRYSDAQIDRLRQQIDSNNINLLVGMIIKR
jgi:hypothetical protein